MFALFFSLLANGQKYAKVLDQPMTAADLEYMPREELKLLKNELIATKGSDIKSIAPTKEAEDLGTVSFLDSVSEANIQLIVQTANHRAKAPACTHQELFDHFIKITKQEQRVPFYLQVLFLKACQKPEANIYLIPMAEQFYTIGISLRPEIGPEQHRIIVFDKAGLVLDEKRFNGYARFEEGKIIHQSFNSLIEYSYTLNEHGKFNEKTPRGKGE